MFTSTSSTPFDNLDELHRQKKQAEMIRQYLQVTNIDTANALPMKRQSITELESCPPVSLTITSPLSSFNFHELRKDLKMAEERVARLREELKEIQKKRDDSFVKPPPPPYIPPLINNTNTEFLNHNRLTSLNKGICGESTSPLIEELLSSQQQHTQQQMVNTRISSSLLPPNYNSFNHYLPPVPADVSKDHRQRQFFLTMRQHREQLVVYLDSLNQALNSLERLASLEPTRSEVHLANIKLEIIQQKSRQLRALKSNRSSQQSPFIECRIRQLEHDLVYMLSEHQKDVQAKLELNEQRSLMLLKIMQVADELASVDQQIQQLSYNTSEMHRINSSSSTHSMNHQQPFRIIQSTHNHDERHAPFRGPVDNNPATKLTNAYYHHYH